MQADVLCEVKERRLTIAGDARCDSPGHSAYMGTYTLLEAPANKILHFELLTVIFKVTGTNTVILCASVASKLFSVPRGWIQQPHGKKGLELALDYLLEQGVNIDMIFPDRHTGVKALLRDNYGGIKHCFDACHLAKGISQAPFLPIFSQYL